MPRGRFITVEGGEGVGKTTQLSVVHDVVRAHGFNVVITREPGGTERAERIRDLVLASGDEQMPPTCELLLMFAARSTHVENVIRPALERGDWVICDRFIDATYAYQGGGRGIPAERIATLENLVLGTLRPDLTLLLDAPAAQSLERALRRNQGNNDRFERERTEFFERVRAAYLERARADTQRIRIVDASHSLAAVAAAVQAVVQEFVTATGVSRA